MMLGRRHHRLQVWLDEKPSFCCCCWCLSPGDRARARRVFKIVRQIKKHVRAQRR